VSWFAIPSPSYATKCVPRYWNGSMSSRSSYGNCSGSHYAAVSGIQSISIPYNGNVSTYQVQYAVHYCGYSSNPCSSGFKTCFEGWDNGTTSTPGWQYDCDGGCYKVHAYTCFPSGWDPSDSSDAEYEFDITHTGGYYNGAHVTAIQNTIIDFWQNGARNASSPATPNPYYQISSSYPCNPAGYDCGTCQ